MLECINKKCGYCENGKCKDEIYINTSCKGICKQKIKPTHTPSYAEEQLNNAIEKENICYNSECQYNNKSGLCKVNTTGEYLLCEDKELEKPKPINYEEEYHKLKKENEELKKNVEGYRKENKEHIEYIQKIQGENKDLKKENDSLKLKAAVTEKLEIEINNLNEIIERKDKEIHDLQTSHNVIEQENNKLKEKKESTIRNDYESENKALRCRFEEIKKTLESKNKYIEEMQALHNVIEQDNSELIYKNETMTTTIKTLASLL